MFQTSSGLIKDYNDSSMNSCPFPSSLDSKKKDKKQKPKKKSHNPPLDFIYSFIKPYRAAQQTESYSTQELSSKTIFHSSSLGDTTALLSLLGKPSPRIITTKPRMETCVARIRLHLLPKGDHTPTQHEENCFVLSRYFFKHNSK